jgi:hypothetical protein
MGVTKGELMRVRKQEILQAMGRTSRRNWRRGTGHRYLGYVTDSEYQWAYRWYAWTYRTPRTRESVLVLARYTKRKTLRVVSRSGLTAARMIAEHERKGRR